MESRRRHRAIVQLVHAEKANPIVRQALGIPELAKSYDKPPLHFAKARPVRVLTFGG